MVRQRQYILKWCIKKIGEDYFLQLRLSEGYGYGNHRSPLWNTLTKYKYDDWIIAMKEKLRFRCYVSKAYFLIIVKGTNDITMLYDLCKGKSHIISNMSPSTKHEMFDVENESCGNSCKSIMCELQWDVHP